MMRPRPWTPADIDGKVVWIVGDDDHPREVDGLMAGLRNRAAPGVLCPPQTPNLINLGTSEAFNGRRLIVSQGMAGASMGYYVPNTFDALRGRSGVTVCGVWWARSAASGGNSILTIFNSGPGHYTKTPVLGVIITGQICVFGLSAVAGELGVDKTGYGNLVLDRGIAQWPAVRRMSAAVDFAAQQVRHRSATLNGTTAIATSLPAIEDARASRPIQIGYVGSYGAANRGFGEILVFDRALSDDELDLVDGYLAHAWGLQDSLADAHPYKAAPPTVDAWDGESISPDAEGVADSRRAPEGTILVQQNAAGEFALCLHASQPGLALDDGLQSAVLVSLFSDARISEDEAQALAIDDRRGWWAAGLAPADGAWGSRLWALDRAKASPETARQAEQRAQEALLWMIDDAIASRVDCAAQWVHSASGARLELRVTVRPSKHLISRYGEVWEATYDL